MISAPYPIIVRDQQLWLSNQRCIFWEDKKILILSDTHFGKTGHFRKEGIGLPQGIYNDDLKRFISTIQYFRPREIIIIGDLFHSYENKEIKQFHNLQKDTIDIPIKLIRGNHDILTKKKYQELMIEYCEPILTYPPFVFTHDIQTTNMQSDFFYFSGHIHPGIQIKSKAKQQIQLPCFYFNDFFSYLPAFSLFTGIHKIKYSKHDAVFMITKNSLIPLV
jgi:DNA ligase-associated metallophosphoesterase